MTPYIRFKNNTLLHNYTYSFSSNDCISLNTQVKISQGNFIISIISFTKIFHSSI